MKGGRENLNSVWCNDVVKGAVRRKETVWKEMLGARDEETKESYMEV